MLGRRQNTTKHKGLTWLGWFRKFEQVVIAKVWVLEIDHSSLLTFCVLDLCLTCQGLRFKKAHVTHPELKATFCLPILGVKKNPSSPLYTTLGVITKGTVIEVNVSELGLVTQGGKVIWGKFVF